MDKVTYRSAVEFAIAHLTNAPVEVLDKLNALSDSLQKKASAERKPTAKQNENMGFKADILAWMENDTLYSVTDFVKGVPSIVASGISPARVTALLTQLKNDGAIVRVEEKRKAYFKLA